MLILVFFAIVFVFPFLFIRKNPEDKENVLDKRTTSFIKGILCIFVMLHNLGLDYLYENWQRPYSGGLWVADSITESTGGIAVGIFFFLSAYGLLISYEKYGNQFLKKLLFKNAVKLYLVAVFINFLEWIFFFRNSFETKDAILRILNLDLFNHFNRMNRHGWFIASLLTLYLIFAIVFFVCSQLKTDKKIYIAGFIVIEITLTLKILSMIFGEGGMYTRELPCFAIGLGYGLYYKQLNPYAKKFFWPVIILGIIVYWMGLFFYEPVGSWALCVLIVTVLQKYSFKNKIIEKMGRICLGIYLFLHLSTLIYWNIFLSNVWLWVIVNAATILGFTIVLEVIIFGLTKLISLLFFKKENNNNKIA